MGVHWKIWLLDGATKNQYKGGIAIEGGFGQFLSLRGGLARKRGGGFEGVLDTPMHTMIYQEICFATGWRWRSTNLEICDMWHWMEYITGLPGLFGLWIFGEM